MTSESAAVTDLFARVAKPLVLGGPLRPLEPIGPVRAQTIAEQALGLSSADTSLVSLARVRQARRLCPVDTVPAITVDEWLMMVALNDLIRSTDPNVGGLLSPGRATHVLNGVSEILARVQGVRTVGEALARHATFAQLPLIQRTDTTVTWWCGSTVFAGRTPPARLLAWPSVRRVHSRSTTRDLADMVVESARSAVRVFGGDDAPSLRHRYEEVLRGLLARTPLTDLAAANRESFRWSQPTISMLLSAQGRTLAFRALRMNARGGMLSRVRKELSSLKGLSQEVLEPLLKSFDEIEAWEG